MIAPLRLTYNAVLTERIDLSPTLAVFRVRPDDGVPDDGAWFTPGQYLTLGLDNAARPDLGAVERPMSIASAPEERRHVEFYIRRVDRPASRNPLTRLLWDRPVGSRLFLRLRPKGRFTIPDTIGAEDRRLRILVSAGTGLAPFVSMVRSARRRDQGSLERFAVLHGASHPHELGYRGELETLAASHGLVYLPTVSRPAGSPDWQGATGRVEDFFSATRLAATADALGLGAGGLGPERAVVYVCGLRGTIEQVLRRLVGRRFVPPKRRMRHALGVADDAAASLFWEHYDRAPILSGADADVLAARARAARDAPQST